MEYTMETRFYQTQELDLQRIAQALVLEYQAHGFEAQQFGTAEQVLVQLKKESTLRAITGFNKALGISLQKVSGGTAVDHGSSRGRDATERCARCPQLHRSKGTRTAAVCANGSSPSEFLAQ